ncbi:hypothetical protein I6F14_10110 [Bradyrhizobium sp. IC3069]|uniref:hypothetical protein n=1 Tax=unclassified Bradyrhizobium TaxID=2631580 RepID=UPI001CD47B70|nr:MULTISPECIES: hypothetical protein [unclassified Bradyrhizobium]MCA1360850.1 hypothetical protein [Bradyrhizobium sp. IC4059]MCA1518351.1 hypothetical protein [Bradyrhizobium sp. IC3069]
MTGIGRAGKSYVGAAGADSTGVSSSSSLEFGLVPGERSQSFEAVVERMRSGPQDRTAPLVNRQPTSDVVAPTRDEVKAAKRTLGSLLEDLNTCRRAATRGRTLSERQELIDQVVKAGLAVLDYYAALPRGLAVRILPDDRARQLRDETLGAADEGNAVAAAIFDDLEKSRHKAALLLGRIIRTASPDQLNRVLSGVEPYYEHCMEWWRKRALRSERMQSVCAATADLPSSTPELRKSEEAALRLHTGYALNTKYKYLESQITLAQLSLASRLGPAVRDALIDADGRVRLLGTFIDDVVPAFASTAEAVMNRNGAPLDAEHRDVLEGVMERLSEFASGVSGMVASLTDAGAGADLPLELLDQIVEGAWLTADEVMRLLALQPKTPATIEPPAWAVLPEHTAGVGEGTAARRKGKGRRAAAAGEGSSTAGGAEPQLAGSDAGTGSTRKVIVLSDLGTKKLTSAEEARARASSSASGNLTMWQAPPSREALTGLLKRLDELLQFDLPAQQSAVSQARQMKPEDADHVLNIVVERLHRQAAEIEACVAALEEPRRSGLLTPAQVPEVHDKIVRLKAMYSEVQGQANSLKRQRAAIMIDCMKSYGFPSQKYLEGLRAAGELEPPDPPRALSGDPGTLFEIKLRPKALRNGAAANPMWVHIHTKRPVHAWQLATAADADFAACHVKSNEQRGYNRHWQSARAAMGHENVVIHRGKLTPAFCRSLLNNGVGNLSDVG